jgi:hypothetical protein
MGLGPVKVLAAQERLAEVGVGLGVVGSEPEGLLPAGGGLVGLAEFVEGVAEVVVGLGEVGPEARGGGEAVAGLLAAAEGLVSDTQVEVEGGGGPEGQGLADVAHGFVGPTLLGGEDAEEVPGIGVGGVGLEGLAIEGLGGGEVPGPLALKGESEQLISTNHCSRMSIPRKTDRVKERPQLLPFLFVIKAPVAQDQGPHGPARAPRTLPLFRRRPNRNPLSPTKQQVQ